MPLIRGWRSERWHLWKIGRPCPVGDETSRFGRAHFVRHRRSSAANRAEGMAQTTKYCTVSVYVGGWDASPLWLKPLSYLHHQLARCATLQVRVSLGGHRSPDLLLSRLLDKGAKLNRELIFMFRSAQPFVLPGLRTALETVKSLGSLVPVPFISSVVEVALNVITAIEVSFSSSLLS